MKKLRPPKCVNSTIDLDACASIRKILFFFLTSFFLHNTLSAQRFEAESATLAGGATVQNSIFQSGGKFVAQGEGNLTFNLSFTTEGTYNIYINAASPYGDKINIFSVNGNSLNFSLVQNPEYINLKVVSNLKLAAGSHKIEILKSWGYINLDFIEFEKVVGGVGININKTLITPNPTDGANRLYQFLYDNYGRRIISGVMTLNSMDETNWLKTNTGKEPALIGLDFMHSGRGYTWYNNRQPIIDAETYYNRNGIPAICWHWRDPSRQTEEFYTTKTNFDVSKVFDETSSEYQAMISDIDYISGLLKELQDKNIPIIWRPLHEAAGGWFWWGAKGSASCKKLFQLMYDRMVNYHGLKNLIWVWTREPNDDEWYPGDAYVDIVGRDIYKQGDHSSQILEFSDLNARYGGKKMITISESGSFPDDENLIKDGAGWSWFMPWYGEFTRDSKHNPLTLWTKMFSSGYVITLDEMPDLKTYQPGSPPVTAIDESAKTQSEAIYPRIVDNELHIENDDVIGSVFVFNAVGLLVTHENFFTPSGIVRFSGISPGLYIVKTRNQIVRVFKK